MSQVSGPVIAVGLVLTAVFVPCAFISGITGQFFRQFALTIATSTVISAFNSLTLSPALAALLLRSHEQEKAAHEVLPRLAFPLFGAGLGYVLLGPPLVRLFEAALPAGVQDTLSLWCNSLMDFLSLEPIAATTILGSACAAILGTMAGWPLSRILNRVLDQSFRPSTRVSTFARGSMGGWWA